MDMIQKKNDLIFGLEDGMIRTTKEEDLMDNNSFVLITESSSESHSSLLFNKSMLLIFTQKKSLYLKVKMHGRNILALACFPLKRGAFQTAGFKLPGWVGPPPLR